MMEEKFVALRNAAGVLQFLPEPFYHRYFSDGKPVVTDDGRPIVSELAELTPMPEVQMRIQQFASGPAIVEIEKSKK
jgi:hypothetical protein